MAQKTQKYRRHLDWTLSLTWSPGLGCDLQLCRHQRTSCALKNIIGCLLNIQLLGCLPWRLGFRGSGQHLGMSRCNKISSRFFALEQFERLRWEKEVAWQQQLDFLQLFLARCPGFPGSLLLLLHYWFFSSALPYWAPSILSRSCLSAIPPPLGAQPLAISTINWVLFLLFWLMWGMWQFSA